MKFLKRCNFWSKLIFAGLIIVNLGSCNAPDAPDYYELVKLDPKTGHLIDSLENTMWHYFAENPDSAEITLFYTIRLLDSLDIPQKKLYAYMHLNELYQYRKPDYFKAVMSLGNAVRIFIQYPGPYMMNPYLFVDVGNNFFHLGYYTQAVTFYKISYDIARQNNENYCQPLALQNIALSFKNRYLYDSAYHYLRMADSSIVDRTDMMLAQNNNYLADLMLVTRNLGGVEKIALANIEILYNYKKHRAEMAAGNKDRIYINWNEMVARSHLILSNLYFLQGQTGLWEQQLKYALAYANETGSDKLKADLYFVQTLQNGMQADQKKLISDVTESYNHILKANDLAMQRAFADSMVVLFGKRNLPLLQKKYSAISLQVGDSLVKQKASTELAQNIMLITSVAAEQAVQKLQLKQLSKNKTIVRQRWTILAFALFAVLMLTTLIIIILLHNRLQHTSRFLVKQIQSSIKPDAETKERKSPESGLYDQLALQLEVMMVNEKPFLNKTLTLNDLAAMLHTNQTYLSNLFNQNYKINFHDYINQRRIQEACRLISMAENKNISIDHLSDYSGFNSKSTFYTAFKKFTGLSPVVFIKNSTEAPLNS
jgi:AraC-like DNA-binding protein